MTVTENEVPEVGVDPLRPGTVLSRGDAWWLVTRVVEATGSVHVIALDIAGGEFRAHESGERAVIAKVSLVTQVMHGTVGRELLTELLEENRAIQYRNMTDEYERRLRDADAGTQRAINDIESVKAAHEEWKAQLTRAAHAEADNRGWCGDFDDFMREVGLPPRRNEYSVTVHVELPVDVTARTYEGAPDEVRQHMVMAALERLVEGDYTGPWRWEARNTEVGEV